jgi:hypothetical protein
VKLAVGDVDGDRLMKDFLRVAYATAQKLLDVEVVLDPSSASPESIPRHEPVIVLSRHCGPGDTVLVAWLLMFTRTAGQHPRRALSTVLAAPFALLCNGALCRARLE